MLGFEVLPPEINSARIYSGPGAGPLIAAATAWDALALELSSVATGYGSIITELAGSQWLGTASASMASAALPYVGWLHASAAQAEHTASQSKEAAAAYELAFAMTVPPAVIAANRTLLMTLVSTNFFGQNTPAIAATELHYAEMWIQDVAAMYGYAASSSAATRLAPFTQPRFTTDPAGLAAQHGAVVHAASTAAASHQLTLSQLVSATPSALQQLATPAASSDPPSISTVLSTGLAATKFTNAALASSSAVASGRGIVITNDRLAFQAEKNAQPLSGSGTILTSTRPPGWAGATVSASVGRAWPIGTLSAPPSWASAAPQVRPVALAITDSGATDIDASDYLGNPQAPGNAFSQATLGTLSRRGFDVRPPKTRPVIVRSPAAG